MRERDVTGLRKVLRHNFCQPLCAIMRPHEVVTDRGGDLLFEPLPHDVPVLTGIAFVDRLLGLAGHPAQPVPEVVIDVGGEVCDAVTELCCHSEVFLCSSSAAARARCSPATAA